MNNVILTGNLATEVEVREFGDDKRLATFSLAVDRAGKDGGADFFRVAAWDKQAQLCADYLTKGRRIGVEGRLKQRSWEEEGQKRSMIEVVAHRIEFLSGPPAASGAEVMPFEAAAA
jgi:single-strand DNA-binding protein